MRNYATSDATWEGLRLRSRWRVALRRLIGPAAGRSEAEHRRAHVLTVLALALLASSALYLVFIISTVTDGLLGPYVLLMASAMALFALALGLNRAGYYRTAAGLIVLCTLLGTWTSIALNLATTSNGLTALSYTVVPVLLCGFLLSTRTTAVLAAAQLAALFLLLRFTPGPAGVNWPSQLLFVLFVSVLSVVSNFVSRRDMAQIDRQTRQLVENEARLRTLSVRDPLTGLFNRRYLEESLAREVQRARRNQRPLAVILVDLDNFKHINDTAGHAAGDQVLREVSALLGANLRGSDIACRYGGDEFVIILPDSTLEDACQKMERLRNAVKSLAMQQDETLRTGFTVSIGVAAFPAHGANAEALLKSADNALYRAKQGGRDRVTCRE